MLKRTLLSTSHVIHTWKIKDSLDINFVVTGPNAMVAKNFLFPRAGKVPVNALNCSRKLDAQNIII